MAAAAAPDSISRPSDAAIISNLWILLIFGRPRYTLAPPVQTPSSERGKKKCVFQIKTYAKGNLNLKKT